MGNQTFLITRKMPVRVVILGGGYAALAAATTLARHSGETALTLVAPRKTHIKITQLHETLRRSLRDLCVPYAELSRRLGLDFVQAKLRFDGASLRRWQNSGVIRLGERETPFDYLIVATGANSILPDQGEGVLTINDFCLNKAQAVIRGLCGSRGNGVEISVTGGGATGLQFLFELSHYLRQKARRPWKLRLVNYQPLLLGQFPGQFHRYAIDRLAREGIEYIPNTAFVRQHGESIVVSTRPDGVEHSLRSNLTLSFMGVRRNPFPIQANCFGQVMVNGEVLHRIFTAGDCAQFAGPGANTLSAQVAVRKGKLVGRNIIAHQHCNQMLAYDYAEQGYIVGLGPMDGIGWVKSTGNIVTGLAASAIKAAIEKQYDLLLLGIDTFTV